MHARAYNFFDFRDIYKKAFSFIRQMTYCIGISNENISRIYLSNIYGNFSYYFNNCFIYFYSVDLQIFLIKIVF